MDLLVFEREEFFVRVVEDERGEPWFVAKDVCDALGLSDVSKAVMRLDEDEKLIRKIFVSGQMREVWMINESGLYALILRSNKPQAKRFRKWVTSEVLPSIRKRGSYELYGQNGMREYMAQMAAGLEQMSRSIEKLADIHIETLKIVRQLARNKEAPSPLRGMGSEEIARMIEELLLERPGMYQTQILAHFGRNRDDRKLRSVLFEYEGKLWRREIDGKKVRYYPVRSKGLFGFLR